MLRELGLNSMSEAVYRAMLAQPGLSAADIAPSLQLPEAQVLEGLETLSALELARPSREHGGRLHAVPPSLGMEILLARQQSEIAAQQQRLEAARSTAAQLIAEYSDMRAPAASGVEHIIGADRI